MDPVLIILKETGLNIVVNPVFIFKGIGVYIFVHPVFFIFKGTGLYICAPGF